MKLGKWWKWARMAWHAARHRTGSVNLIVTRRCDLACSYCHAVRKTKELTAAQWLAIAHRLRKRFAVFTISGGEPLLYRELHPLLAGLAPLGIVGLCTNLRRLDPFDDDLFRHLDYLNVSLDRLPRADEGASPKDGFGKLPALVEAARRHGVVLRATAVVTRRTAPTLIEVVQATSVLGIPLNVQLVQSPTSADAFEDGPALADLAEVVERLRTMKRAGFLIDEPDGYLAGFLPYLRGETAVRCLAGEAYLAVDADGRPMPCQATSAVQESLLDFPDDASMVEALRAGRPQNCRCWWNCYDWYARWHRSPWRYLAEQGTGFFRRRPRPT